MGNDTESRVRRALGTLRDLEEVERQMAPDAPGLVANQLHPRVWSAASAIWDTGEYRVAVSQAALALSMHIKARSESKLRAIHLSRLRFVRAYRARVVWRGGGPS